MMTIILVIIGAFMAGGVVMEHAGPNANEERLSLHAQFDNVNVDYACFDYRDSNILIFITKKDDPSSGYFAKRSPKGVKSKVSKIKSVGRDSFDPNYIRYQVDTGVDYMIDIWPIKGNDYSEGLSKRDGVRSEAHMFCLEGREFMSDEALAISKIKDILAKMKGKPRIEPYGSGVDF